MQRWVATGRFELSEGVFAWWCTRDDGSEDGFVEMNPDGAPGDGRRASDELWRVGTTPGLRLEKYRFAAEKKHL